MTSNTSTGKDDKKEKDKETDKDKGRLKSGLRKSLEFAIGGAAMKRSPSDNTEQKMDSTVPPPSQQRPKGQVSQIMEESLSGQRETYQNKRPEGKDATDEEQVPLSADDEDDEECTDLILVVHGIGEFRLFIQIANQAEGALARCRTTASYYL